MIKEQTGFTLVELIIVIMILGILAAVALPKFVNFKGEAEDASLSGIASAMGAAMQINYAGCEVTSQVASTGKCIAISDCDQIGNLLQEGQFPDGYYVQQANLPMRGSVTNCTVVQIASGKTASFKGIGTVNN